MSDGRRSPRTVPAATPHDGAEKPSGASALEENVETIKRWERDTLLGRSRAEQVSDWIARIAGNGAVLLLHVAWFGAWIGLNVGMIDGVRPFDPFPFPFLTMTVSLEAIFLTLIVLTSQSRLTRQAEKRSHLNLQVDLLAEREMTAVLRLLKDIARHLEVETSVTPDQLRDLAGKTNVPQLTARMQELAEPVAAAGPADADSAEPDTESAERNST